MGTWWQAVDVYIALTEFCRRKFIEGGLPAEKIVVKPNFITTDPGVGGGRGEYGVFVGRLAPHQGLETLLKAWKTLGGKVPLKVVGDGPMTATVQGSEAKDAGIEWLGRRSAQEVYSLIGEAMFLVFPSEWYENLRPGRNRGLCQGHAGDRFPPRHDGRVGGPRSHRAALRAGRRRRSGVEDPATAGRPAGAGAVSPGRSPRIRAEIYRRVQLLRPDGHLRTGPHSARGGVKISAPR